MVYVEGDYRHTPRLLVGCGNSIKTINTSNHSDDVQEFIILREAAPEKQHVEGVVCSYGSVWCFLSQTSKIYRFDKSSGVHLGTLCVGSSLKIGGSLFSQNNTLLPVPIDVYDESTEVGNIDETIQVTSLIAIKDSLWIGRNTGDILVVSAVDSQNDLGKLKAVLEVDHLLGIPVGPVINIFYPTSGKVVAIREITKTNEPTEGTVHDYQLLVWEDWGVAESDDFQNALRIRPL